MMIQYDAQDCIDADDLSRAILHTHTRLQDLLIFVDHAQAVSNDLTLHLSIGLMLTRSNSEHRCQPRIPYDADS